LTGKVNLDPQGEEGARGGGGERGEKGEAGEALQFFVDGDGVYTGGQVVVFPPGLTGRKVSRPKALSLMDR